MTSHNGSGDGTGAPLVALCRHGDHAIERLESGIWVDEHGFPTCVKAPSVGLKNPALHEPMPDGLAGSPSHG